MLQRLFIAWSHPLFREIVFLLLNDPMLEIVGHASNYEAALNQLERLKPDVVIVEETEDSTVTRMEALEILKACSWGLRVIRLSLHDNELWVYHHERQRISVGEELLCLVRDS